MPVEGSERWRDWNEPVGGIRGTEPAGERGGSGEGMNQQDHVKGFGAINSRKHLQPKNRPKTENLELRCDKIDVTHELQARRGHRSAEPKPFAGSHACRQKFYILTRRTKEHVWLRWNGYARCVRGLSIRITPQQLKTEWIQAATRDAFKPFTFFRKSR